MSLAWIRCSLGCPGIHTTSSSTKVRFAGAGWGGSLHEMSPTPSDWPGSQSLKTEGNAPSSHSQIQVPDCLHIFLYRELQHRAQFSEGSFLYYFITKGIIISNQCRAALGIHREARKFWLSLASRCLSWGLSFPICKIEILSRVALSPLQYSYSISWQF